MQQATTYIPDKGGRLRSMSSAFNALIRTHHITSRKKVAVLRKAAHEHKCAVLLRSGGSPGIMYCHGSEESVKEWVGVVQRLRYKDYHLAARPAKVQPESAVEPKSSRGSVSHSDSRTTKDLFSFSFEELPTVKFFAERMEKLDVLQWWRRAMEFDK